MVDAKQLIFTEQASDLVTGFARQQPGNQGEALVVELAADLIPVQPIDGFR